MPAGVSLCVCLQPFSLFPVSPIYHGLNSPLCVFSIHIFFSSSTSLLYDPQFVLIFSLCLFSLHFPTPPFLPPSLPLSLPNDRQLVPWAEQTFVPMVCSVREQQRQQMALGIFDALHQLYPLLSLPTLAGPTQPPRFPVFLSPSSLPSPFLSYSFPSLPLSLSLSCLLAFLFLFHTSAFLRLFPPCSLFSYLSPTPVIFFFLYFGLAVLTCQNIFRKHTFHLNVRTPSITYFCLFCVFRTHHWFIVLYLQGFVISFYPFQFS